MKIEDNQLVSKNYDGTQSVLDTNDIQHNNIETNDKGPWETGLWWVMIGSKNVILVPDGATGVNDRMTYFQALQGFNNETLIEAMTSTSHKTFKCWSKRALHKCE